MARIVSASTPAAPPLLRTRPQASRRTSHLWIRSYSAWNRRVLVQMAAKLVIEPIFEAGFQPGSYGFRPRKSATQALEAIRAAGDQGMNFVVDADIQGYFLGMHDPQEAEHPAQPPLALHATVAGSTGGAATAHPTAHVHLGSALRDGFASIDGHGEVPHASHTRKIIVKPCAGKRHARFERGY
jgi:hypothetical protein